MPLLFVIFNLPTHPRESLGGIIVGDGLDVNIRTGKLSVNFPDTPVATTEELGVIKVGDGLKINSSGVLSAKGYTLPTATYESVDGASIGGVMVGKGLTINRLGVLSANIPDLPTANEYVKGGIKIGEGLYRIGESLNAEQYTLETARVC